MNWVGLYERMPCPRCKEEFKEEVLSVGDSDYGSFSGYIEPLCQYHSWKRRRDAPNVEKTFEDEVSKTFKYFREAWYEHLAKYKKYRDVPFDEVVRNFLQTIPKAHRSQIQAEITFDAL